MAGMRREAAGYRWTRVLAIAIFVALAGCDSDNDDAPAGLEEAAELNPATVSGRVLVTADQVAALEERGAFARLLAFLAPRAEARLSGLTPAANLEVELVRLDEAASPIEPPLQSTFTDADGVFGFESLPQAGRLALRAAGLPEPQRAFVSGPRVDITPASEAAVRRVAAALGDDVPLSNYTLPELAAIDGLMRGLPVDLEGRDFESAVVALTDAAGPLLGVLVTGFASDEVSAPAPGTWGAVEYTSVVRDPAAAGARELAGGVDLGAGIGSLSFGDAAGTAEPAFLPRELFLLEPDGRLRNVTGASQDIASGADPGAAVHVASGGLLVVVDRDADAREVAGVGAIDDGRGLLVYPVGLTLGEEDAPAAAGHGLRVAARWMTPSPAAPLDVFARGGAEPTLYHAMRLSQGLSGPDGAAFVSAAAGSGTLSFDGARQARAFPGDVEEREYGGFSMTLGRDAVATGAGETGFPNVERDGAAGAGQRRGLFYVVPGTGLLELRGADPAGTPVGAGVFSADGEVLAIQSARGDAAGGTLERSLTVAIRHAEGGAIPMAGVYQAVHYVAWVGAGSDDGDASAGNGVSYGTLELSGDDGVVAAATTVGRRALLDLDAAAEGTPAALEVFADQAGATAPGTFSVGSNGSLRLDVTLEGERGEAQTLRGTGAVTSDGDFAVLATRVRDASGLTAGRGMLFLVRIAQ